MRAADARRAWDRRALVQGALIIAVVLLLCIGLSSCGGEPEVRPPAVEASELHQAAAQAEVDAAEAEAVADAAPASQDADALRVAAARLRGRATALDELASRADQRAAEAERQAELRAWRTTCRWVGVLSLFAGAVIAGIGFRCLVPWMPSIGLLLAGCGAVVQAWGEALGVLTWLLPVALGLAGIAVLVRHLVTKEQAVRLRDEVAVESAHLIDAAERGWDNLGRVTSEVKTALRAAQERAGNHRLVQIARGKLKET